MLDFGGLRGSMSQAKRTSTVAARNQALLIAGILLVALNLRPTLASVGPLVDQIQAATGLSHTALGLLTTLPLLAFAAISNVTPIVTRNFGVTAALIGALLLILIGGVARALGSTIPLFGGTVLLGIGIALGNVLLPAIVKRDFEHRSGAMTSLYSSFMAVGASVAAGLSVPLSRVFGWQAVLAIWALPALPALLVWSARSRTRTSETDLSNTRRRSGISPWRSPLAWQVAAFMGLQSMTFYVFLAWLPDLLQARGMTALDAGWMLALSQATGIAGSAAVPIAGGRMPDQRGAVVAMGILEGIALMGLLLIPVAALTLVWVSLIGFALGGTFGLALLFLVLRATDTESTTRLSGMAQSVGYLIAASGPVITGFLFDVTHSWNVPLAFLVLVWIAKLGSGMGAGRARTLASQAA